MEESRTKNSSKNIIFGLTNKLSTIVFPFITRTIIIYTLGSEYIGLDSLFVSIFQVLNFAEVGFGTAIVYNMYKPIAENDNETICQLLNLYKKVYKFIGIIITAVGLCIMPFLKYFIAGSYPQNINIYILYILYLLNTVFGYFFYAYKASLLSAHQKDNIGGKISTELHIVVYLIQIIVLKCFKNYYIYIIFLPIFTILFNLIRAHKVDQMYPDLKPQGTLKKQKLIEIKKNVIGLVGYRLEGYALTSVDNIMISSILGLVTLAHFNNYYYVISALGGLLTVCYGGITASIGNSIVTEKTEKNKQDFEFFTFLNIWLIGWCSICLICLYQNFILLWVGKDDLLPVFTMQLFAIYFFVNHMRRIVTTYRDAAGLWWYDRFRPYVIVILNVILDYILLRSIGINGVLISTILLSLLVSMPWEADVLFKCYFGGRLVDYFKRILKYVFQLIISGMLCYFVISNLSNSVFSFFIKILLCLIVPNVAMLIMNIKNPYIVRIRVMLKNICMR